MRLESCINALVVVLGFALAWGLALLALGEPSVLPLSP